jgi:hypothetical protein
VGRRVVNVNNNHMKKSTYAKFEKTEKKDKEGKKEMKKEMKKKGKKC